MAEPDWEHVAELAGEGMTAAAGPLFEARYPGTCHGCGERWAPGDKIAWGNGEDSFVCSGCAVLA